MGAHYTNMDSQDLAYWQHLEAQYLSKGIDSGDSRICLNWYVQALTAKHGPPLDEIVNSLRRVTAHIYSSGGTQLINPCSTLFEVYHKYKLWNGYLTQSDDEHMLAALALISTRSLHEDVKDYFKGVSTYTQEWLGVTFEYKFDTRVKDLSDILFGTAWTSIYEAELSNERGILDAVMGVRPAFIHKTKSAAPGCLEAASSVPDDVAF